MRLGSAKKTMLNQYNITKFYDQPERQNKIELSLLLPQIDEKKTENFVTTFVIIFILQAG